MKQQVKLYKIKGNPKNPRIIKDDKFKKLVKSIKDFPEMLEKRPIIVDEELMVLGGNMRLKASAEAGLKEVWIDVADGWTQEQKDEFVVKDNVNFGEWDWSILANEWDSVEITEWGLDVWQNEDDIKEEVYSKNINIPTYEPKNKKPIITDLFDTKKADELITKIKNTNLSEEETMFLSHSALRHTVFNYSKIADYYAHSSKEIQELMEDNALVIIDYNKAIENGFVQLSEYLTEIQKNDE